VVAVSLLGTRPRFVLDGIGQGWRRHASYQVRSDVRGKFEIGPMSGESHVVFWLIAIALFYLPSAAVAVWPWTRFNICCVSTSKV